MKRSYLFKHLELNITNLTTIYAYTKLGAICKFKKFIQNKYPELDVNKDVYILSIERYDSREEAIIEMTNYYNEVIFID